MPGVATLAQDMLTAVRDLRDAQAELEKRSRELPERERDYRLAKSIAFTRATGANIPEREANAELMRVNSPDGTVKTLAEWRYDRDMSENLRDSAREAVRTHRQVVSALQSLAGLERSEAELARFGPQEAYG